MPFAAFLAFQMDGILLVTQPHVRNAMLVSTAVFVALSGCGAIWACRIAGSLYTLAWHAWSHPMAAIATGHTPGHLEMIACGVC